jgi:VWFA-related protein
MRRKVSTVGKLIGIGLVLLATAASAQDFRIRAKIDLVVVPVTVKGSGEKLITGLQKDDFVVLEGGRRQTITNFTTDPVPLSAVVLVDTGVSSGSLSKIQQTFTALAGAFSEFDEVAVYRYDKFVTKVLDFSRDAEHVETAMKTLRDLKPDSNIEQTNLTGGPFSIPGPVINGAAVVPPGQLGILVTIPPKPSKVLHDAIFAAATDLAGRDRTRRKIVLVISDGESTGNTHSFEETIQSLLEKGVQVYAVGIDQPFPYKTLSVLHDYAKATGGDAYFVGSIQNIETAYATVTEEARNQYVLGYVSTNEVAGAGPVFRDIDVAVSRQNLKTLHRKGYYQYP